MSQLKLVPLGAGQGTAEMMATDEADDDHNSQPLQSTTMKSSTDTVAAKQDNTHESLNKDDTISGEQSQSMDTSRSMNTTKSLNTSMQDKQNETVTELVQSARLQALLKALDKTVARSLTGCKFSAFAKAYSKLHRSKPRVTKKVSESFLIQMHDCLLSDIRSNLVEDKLPEKLLELQKLAEDAPVGVRAWRPSGDVKEDMVAHTIPALQQHKARMEESLLQLNKENQLLLESYRARKERCEKNSEMISKSLAELDQKAALLDNDR